MDKRKHNLGQPKKPQEDIKVPLTFHVKRKNKVRIKAALLQTVKNLDV